MAFKMPEANQLVQMMDMMLGAETSAVVSEDFDAATATHTALYVDDDGETVASCRCTLPTAAALGSALSMIPPGGAESMVEDKALSQVATENLYEVMNIFSSLMMDDKTSHLKLMELQASNDASIEGESCAFAIDLGKYGTGHLLFNVAASA